MSDLAVRDDKEALALLDDAEQALALVSTADEAEVFFRKIRVVDAAVRLAGLHAQTQLRAGRLKLRAERRWGELLPPADEVDLSVPKGNGLTGSERKARLRARQVFDGPEKVFKAYLTTVKDPEMLRRARLLRIYREHEAENRATEAAPVIPDGVDIRHCSAADLEVDRASVALVFTDPPYPAEYLPAWESLGEFASRAPRGARPRPSSSRASGGSCWVLPRTPDYPLQTVTG